ncbi:GWxTD domain-containing protein [bacterium]|nr:GWxTD domain-containing protein [bacterium]
MSHACLLILILLSDLGAYKGYFYSKPTSYSLQNPVADSVDINQAKEYLGKSEFKKVIDLYKSKFKKRKCTSDEYKVYAVARLKTYQSDIITRRLIDRLMGDNLRHARIGLHEAMKIDSGNIETKYFYGIFSGVEGKEEKAIYLLNQVFESDHTFRTYAYSDVVTELTSLHAKRGDFEAIKELHQKELSSNPDNAWSKIRLGISYGILGDDRKMTELYYEGMEALNENDQLNRLFSEFSILASPGEKEKWGSLELAKDKTSFIRSFWKKRDPNLFDDRNDAMIQFYKRLFYARAVYHKQADPQYDDRGVIYIRFGKPDRIVYGSGDTNVRENESWVYYSLENGMHFDFVLMGSDYKLRPLRDAVFISFPASGEKTLLNLFRERSSVHPFYAGILMKMETGRLNAWNIESSFDYTSGFEKMMSYAKKQYFAYSDSAAPIFGNARYAFFKEKEGRTRMDFYYMIPYRQMTFLEGPDHSRKESAISVTMKIMDPQTYDDIVTVEHNDTVRADSLQENTFVFVDEFRQSLVPGKYLVAFQVSNNDKKKLNRYQYELDFKDYSADTLVVSDIQLALSAGQTHDPSRFIKPHTEIKVVPNPSARCVKNQSLSLYYEIYNLTLDNESVSSYEVSYSIKMQSYQKSIFKMIGDFFSRNKVTPGVISATTKRGLSTTEREYIAFDISELPAGEARLEVKIRDMLSQRYTSSFIDIKIGEPQKSIGSEDD